jgi:hypothetical protein
MRITPHEITIQEMVEAGFERVDQRDGRSHHQ